MWSLIWSPIPLIINFVLILVLYTPPVSTHKWAKICRILFICLLVTQILFMFTGLQQKVTDGQRSHDAFIVVTFTKHINQLISEGHYLKASQALEKFNAEYPFVVLYEEKTKKLFNDLIQKNDM